MAGPFDDATVARFRARDYVVLCMAVDVLRRVRSFDDDQTARLNEIVPLRPFDEPNSYWWKLLAPRVGTGVDAHDAMFIIAWIFGVETEDVREVMNAVSRVAEETARLAIDTRVYEKKSFVSIASRVLATKEVRESELDQRLGFTIKHVIGHSSSLARIDALAEYCEATFAQVIRVTTTPTGKEPKRIAALRMMAEGLSFP